MADVDIGLWIRSGAIILSFVGVILTLIWNRKIARKRATLDMVLAEETDADYVKQRTKFVKLRDAGHMAKWADPTSTTSDESATIRAILNRYELIAIGIGQGIVDEQSYRRWCRTTLVKDWVESKSLVMQLRNNSKTPTFYIEFEALARKWAKASEKPHV